MQATAVIDKFIRTWGWIFPEVKSPSVSGMIEPDISASLTINSLIIETKRLISVLCAEFVSSYLAILT